MNFCHTTLFYMKYKACVRYFLQDCTSNYYTGLSQFTLVLFFRQFVFSIWIHTVMYFRTVPPKIGHKGTFIQVRWLSGIWMITFGFQRQCLNEPSHSSKYPFHTFTWWKMKECDLCDISEGMSESFLVSHPWLV